MSDILASIRKIMAQDPAPGAPAVARPPAGAVTGTPRGETPSKVPSDHADDGAGEPGKVSTSAAPAAAGPAPAAKPAEPATVATASPAPSRRPPLSAEEPVSLDEFLALAVPAKAASASPAMGLSTAKPQRAETPDDPVTVPLSPAAPAAGGGRSTVQAGSAIPAPEPGIAKPLPSKTTSSPTLRAEPGPAPVPAKQPAAEAMQATPATSPLADLGSVVPSRTDGGQNRGGEHPMAGADRFPATTGPVFGAVHPSAPPAEAGRPAPAAEPIPEIPGADALRRLIPVVAPVSAQVAVKAPKPNSDDVVTEVVLRSPLKAPDAAPAAKAEPARVEKAGPPNGAAPTPAADAKPAATAPPAEDKPALAVKPGPSVTMSEAAPVTPGIGKSMEDTVVELLRPLLREWLDKNMPRLIEPALKAELEALRDVIDKGRQD